MRNQHGDFIWYELVTTDLNGAQAFYEAVLGWAIRDSGVPDMDYRLAATATQDIAGLMALPAEALEAGARPVWLGYVAVDDVDAAVAKIVAEGGSVQMPAMDMPGVGRFAMVMDPDGLPFYVMRGALNDTSHAFSGSAIGHCSWNELSAKSLTGAEKFYTPQFGWHFADGMDMGEMGMYKFIQLGEKGIGGAMQAHEMAGPPLWNFYFRVADIDKAAATIQAQGGKILHGPSEVPGNDFIINGLDPQGVLFSWWEHARLPGLNERIEGKQMRDVMLEREPVELYKVLKFEGLAEHGGAAKSIVSEGLVKVNGEVETRKRRKIVSGDTIECGGEALRMVGAGLPANESHAAPNYSRASPLPHQPAPTHQ